MKRIEHLTSSQQAKLTEYRDKWTAIGLSTAPADRVEAERAIRLSYRLTGLQEPQKVVWCGSPLSQGLTRAILFDKNAVGDSVGDSVWDSVRASVRDSVWASVRASVRDSVRASVGASVRDSVGDSGYGHHDANWLAFYEYFREVCQLQSQTDQLVGLTQYAKAAGWFLAHQHICWVSERHHVLHRDALGRLHHVSGPSVMYPDGWAIYAWHGVRVPKQVIEAPDTLTAQQISKETNAEVRRVMVERLGIEKVCQLFRATTLDERGDYQLLNLDLGDGRIRPYLKMKNPSVGCYHIEGVAPHITTVQQAINWRAGNENEKWEPQIIT